MKNNGFKKAAILAVVVLLGFVAFWEFYLRQYYPISYNDDESLWAEKRKSVYQPAEEATVFIGSSRIKFDLDIPTWERLTGDKAVQLSFVGTSPRPLLDDLADDKAFKGKVIIDVTEGIFFDPNEKRANSSATKAIAYYKDWTPAQKMSSRLNAGLESSLVFLDKDKFSLNGLLNDIPLPNRKGVFVFPLFPRGFEMNTSERQNFMSEHFIRDTAQHNKQIANWIFFGDTVKAKGIGGDSLQTVFNKVKTSIDKIKARGGQVLFVRTPSSGGYIETEKFNYPRELYWDRLLSYTNTQGIHFEDYPETAAFICPEWSHLTPTDAVIYTTHFIKQLEQKGWKFPNKQPVHLNQTSSQPNL